MKTNLASRLGSRKPPRNPSFPVFWEKQRSRKYASISVNCQHPPFYAKHSCVRRVTTYAGSLVFIIKHILNYTSCISLYYKTTVGSVDWGYLVLGEMSLTRHIAATLCSFLLQACQGGMAKKTALKRQRTSRRMKTNTGADLQRY